MAVLRCLGTIPASGLPLLQAREQLVGVEKVVGPGVGAEGLAPVVVDAEEPALVDDREGLRRVNVHHIHDPDLQIPQRRRKPEEKSSRAPSRGGGREVQEKP